MEIKRLSEQLEAYSKMEEGECRTITCDLLDTLEQAKDFIRNNTKVYWEQCIKDYISCRYDYDELESKLNKLSNEDIKKFYDKMVDGILWI